MSWIAVLSVVLCCGTLVLSNAETDREMAEEFAGRYEDAFDAMGISVDQRTAPADDSPPDTMGAKFQCLRPTNEEEPTSVHQLTPGQVDVVAAMGDSVTAAFGARSPKLLALGRLITEYRGISWSIGGDGIMDNVVTLPNAIQHFNRNLVGFSTGTSQFGIPQSGLNVAVTGARTDDMLGQAQNLVRLMREQGITDEQWKVITLWIGGNDLCDIRIWDNAETQARIFTENVERALNYLRDNVKRAFINMVQMINVAELGGLRRADCDTVRFFVCNGVSKSFSRGIVADAAEQYNRRLEALINNGERYDRDDFTVVLQPFFVNTPLPEQANGAPDFSYFAPDCFHFSQLGHSVVATYLWNNMFEPVGAKTSEIDWNNLQSLTCPEEGRFFATYRNSRPPQKSALLDSGSSIVEDGSSNSALPTTSSFSLLIVVAVLLSQLM